MWIFNVQKNGEQVYLKIRQDIFFRKLTYTIHRRNLPSFITENPKGKVQQQAKPVTAKYIAATLCDVEITTIRGMSQGNIFSLAIKLHKAKLVTKLES